MDRAHMRANRFSFQSIHSECSLRCLPSPIDNLLILGFKNIDSGKIADGMYLCARMRFVEGNQVVGQWFGACSSRQQNYSANVVMRGVAGDARQTGVCVW